MLYGRTLLFIHSKCNNLYLGFPGSSDSEESTYNAGDPGLIPGLGRSPGEGNGYPLQHSFIYIYIYFIFGGAGSSLSFTLVARAGATL